MTQGAGQRITPVWLRPLAAATALLLHASVLVGAPWPATEPPVVMGPLSVQVVPMGEIATVYDAPQQATVAEVTAVEARASDAQAAQAKMVEPPEPQPVEPLEQPEQDHPKEAVEIKVAEAPVLVPEALLQAVEKLDAPLMPLEAKEQKIAEPVEPKREVERKPKRRERHKETAVASAHSRASALAQQSTAQSVTGSIASANYRAIVAAELNRRKFYPSAARSSALHGVVVVTFTVGADGRVAHHTINRSSGQPALDGAVHQMMAAVTLPPPPGGSFHATVPIRFDIAP